jgi:two-component sensor histidine kinase/CHASE1-domain containing sensor protein
MHMRETMRKAEVAGMGRSQPRSWHRLTLAAIAGGGIALSVILAVHFSNLQIEEKRHQLTVEAVNFANDLEEYLQSREMIAKAVGTVFEAPDLSQPNPLRLIGKKVLALTPDIAVMAWIPMVDPSRIHEVLDALSAAGRAPQLYGPHFETLDVADIHRVLYPIVDIEPKSADNQVALGMDIGLFPSRKVAFEQARDEQSVIATAPVELLQPFNTTGYVLYSPVYNERGFVGCINFAFRVDQLLHGFVHGRQIPMNLRVYDATDAGQLKYLGEITQQGDIDTVNSAVRFDEAEAVRQSVDFASRKILVLFDPGPDLIKVGMQQALLFGFVGLLLTGMILWSMYYLMRSSQRLESEIETSNLMKVSLELTNRELAHRVGNLLAVAQGIIQLSYNASLSAVEFKDSIISRLHALQISVGLINREDWKGVRLYELLQMELAPVADRINISGLNALLKPKAAQSLSLLFYELMTKSSKHGALSKREGTVTAEWEIKESESGRMFCFRWKEHGHGIIEPPTSQGFGTKLLTRLVPGDLLGRASLNYELGCFRYELEAPFERVVEREINAGIVKAVFPLRAIGGNLRAVELV